MSNHDKNMATMSDWGEWTHSAAIMFANPEIHFVGVGPSRFKRADPWPGQGPDAINP